MAPKSDSPQALSAAQVAEYLRTHPEFFESQTELLADLRLPHESGKAISLLERQVVILRERGQEARQKLGSLLANARDNDQLFDVTRDLVLSLLRARDATEVAEITQDKLTWSVSSEQFKFPYIQVFDTKRESLPEKIKLNIDAIYRKDMEVSNIIGFVESKQPSDSFIIVSAHYDHLGRMGKNTYFPGANDNASGVAMMLSLAKEIQQHPLPKHNVLFVAFAGEEIGLEGSQFFVNQHILGNDQITLVLNLDIMGSGEEGITVVNGAIHKLIFQRLVDLNKSTASVDVIKPRGKAANSDHYPFSELGIPALFIYTMGPNKNYHDIHDTSDALTFDRFDQLHYLLLRFLQTF